MRTFHGDAQLKSDILAEVQIHREQDQIIKGSYAKTVLGVWKGCAVGCSIHSLNVQRGTSYDCSNHLVYEEGFGVPVQLAHLQDYLFERLNDEKSLDWPRRFWQAIEPGADLSLVGVKFTLWLLEDSLPLSRWPDTTKLLTDCAELYRRWAAGDKPDEREFAARADLAALAALAARAGSRRTAIALAALAARAGSRRTAIALAALADRAGSRRTAIALADLAALAALAARAADKLIQLLEEAPVIK